MVSLWPIEIKVKFPVLHGISTYLHNFGTLNLQLGDSIEVSGVLGQFGGELQIISPIVATNRKAGAPVPDPFERTTGAIAAAVTANGVRAADIGRLLVVRARHAPRQAMLRALSHLKHERIQGVVFNDYAELLRRVYSYGQE